MIQGGNFKNIKEYEKFCKEWDEARMKILKATKGEEKNGSKTKNNGGGKTN